MWRVVLWDGGQKLAHSLAKVFELMKEEEGKGFRKGISKTVDLTSLAPESHQMRPETAPTPVIA